jgi:succinate dehydrogenase/fumarate reductase flavoprotein subunit
MSAWSRSADVVIVGSGIAGLSAAAAAASRGASVLVLEKSREIGGTSIYSSGEFWVPNNQFLRAEGIEDPRDDCLRYMARLSYPGLYDPSSPTLGLGSSEFELLEAYYDRGSEAVDHLHEIGAVVSRFSPDFEKVMGKPEYNAHLPENKVAFGRHLLSEGGIHTSGQGAFLIGGLRDYLEKTDTQVLHSHQVDHLVRNDAGDVIGVEVTAAGEKQRIRARKGVIFGSGGFSHNEKLCNTFLHGRLYGTTAVETNTGDFVRIAMEVGASLGNMANAWFGQVPIEEAIGEGRMDYMMYFPWGDSMIMVDRYGKRVVNEKAPYHDRGYVHFYFDPTTKQYKNQVLFMLYDGVVAETEEEEGWHKVRRPVPPVGQFPDYQVVAETWEELADEIEKRLERLGPYTGGLRLDPGFVDALKDQVARYNEYARAGVDAEFHRGETPHELNYSPPIREGLPNQTMAPFTEAGPYCAIILGAACFDTAGGPRINGNAQIIDVDDHPIAGLYGAGNCIASPAGQAYWSGGTTIGSGLIFGYIAGTHVAGEPDRPE